MEMLPPLLPDGPMDCWLLHAIMPTIEPAAKPATSNGRIIRNFMAFLPRFSPRWL
jgi:hypothetical protein